MRAVFLQGLFFFPLAGMSYHRFTVISVCCHFRKISQNNPQEVEVVVNVCVVKKTNHTCFRNTKSNKTKHLEFDTDALIRYRKPQSCVTH